MDRDYVYLIFVDKFRWVKMLLFVFILNKIRIFKSSGINIK